MSPRQYTEDEIRDLLERGLDPAEEARKHNNNIEVQARKDGPNGPITPEYVEVDDRYRPLVDILRGVEGRKSEVKPVEFPKSELEAVGALGVAPTIVTLENFRGISYDQALESVRNIDEPVSGNGHAWRHMGLGLLNSVQDFKADIVGLDARGDWEGDAHDAAMDTVLGSLPALERTAQSARALGTVLDYFDNVMSATKRNIVDNETSYRDSLNRWPEYADLVRQRYSDFAQTVFSTIYAPAITDIATNNPDFASGQAPKLGAPPPTPSPMPTPQQLPERPPMPEPPPSPGGGPNPNAFDNAANNVPPDLENLLNTGRGGPNPDDFPGLSGVGLNNAGLNNAVGEGLGEGIPVPGGVLPPGTGLPTNGDPNSPRSQLPTGRPPAPPTLEDVANTLPPMPGNGFGRNPQGTPLNDPSAALQSLQNTGGLNKALGTVGDAVKQATSAGQKPMNNATLSTPNFDPKGLSELAKSEAGAGTQNRTGGAAGIRPGGSPLGAPVAALSAGQAVAPTDLARAAVNGQLGAASPAMGAGGMPPPGGAPAGGQRGPTDKDHKPNKALRGKKNGEEIIGEVHAMVPVIGGEQDEQHSPTGEEGEQSPRQRPATRGPQPHPVSRKGSEANPAQPSRGT